MNGTQYIPLRSSKQIWDMYYAAAAVVVVGFNCIRKSCVVVVLSSWCWYVYMCLYICLAALRHCDRTSQNKTIGGLMQTMVSEAKPLVNLENGPKSWWKCGEDLFEDRSSSSKGRTRMQWSVWLNHQAFLPEGDFGLLTLLHHRDEWGRKTHFFHRGIGGPDTQEEVTMIDWLLGVLVSP